MSEPVLNQPVSQSALALFDLVEGARLTHLWGRLGWQDIRRRYRRSTLGPFWVTITGTAATFVSYVRYHWRIAYWV